MVREIEQDSVVRRNEVSSALIVRTLIETQHEEGGVIVVA